MKCCDLVKATQVVFKKIAEDGVRIWGGLCLSHKFPFLPLVPFQKFNFDNKYITARLAASNFTVMYSFNEGSSLLLGINKRMSII